MAQNNTPQGGTKVLDPMVIAALLFLVLILAAILWSRFHTQISAAYSYLRMAQFLPFWVLGETSAHLSTPFHDWFVFFWQSDKSLMQLSHITESSLLANAFTLVVVIVPAAIFLVRRSLANNPYNHKHYGKVRDYSLHTFTDTMAEHYPHLKLFRKLNLTARPINTGKYRMADTEKQIAIKLDLLDRVKGNEFKVNRERAMEVFRAQLGRAWKGDPKEPWKGYAHLTRSEYAVIAALLPRLAATDEEMSEAEYKKALATTERLIAGYWRDAAESYDKEKDSIVLDLEEAKASVRKYGKHPKVLKIIRSHAYVSTIIYAMLAEARTLGVLAACDMRWLRVGHHPDDRRLWLLFDNVGRIVAFAEIAGVYSHFLHEQRHKRAIDKPQVDAAVKGLTEAVDSFKFTDKEIEEVNRRLKEKDEAEKASIDLDVVTEERRTLILAVATVEKDGKSDLLEAALLTENGEAVFVERCKPSIEIDEQTRRSFGFEDSDLVDLVKKGVDSSKLKQRLLEACNGQRVVTFDDRAASVISGLERSVGELVVCAPLLDGAAGSVFDAAALLSLGLVPPTRRSVAEEAKASRLIWVELQKKALRAQQPAK